MYNNCFFENLYQWSRDCDFPLIVQYFDFVKGLLRDSYVLHMYDCVQLLVYLFYFIMDCVSDPALEIQIWMVA